MKFIGIKLFIRIYFYPFNTYSMCGDVTSLIPDIENLSLFSFSWLVQLELNPFCLSQGRTNTIWYHLYVESKTWHKWTYLWNRKRLTDIENRFVVAKGEGGRGVIDWEFRISKCKLLYIGWINNRSYCVAQGTIFNTLW